MGGKFGETGPAVAGESTNALSYREFMARYSAALATLGHEGGVDPQTTQEMHGVLHCLRVENPGHLGLLQQTVEFDVDI